MVKHLLLLLGMPDGSTVADVKKQYARMLNRLSDREPVAYDGIADGFQPARQRLSESFEHWKKVGALDGEELKKFRYLTPKLGQILVASDRLTLLELVAVLELQKDLPGKRFGEVLVSAGFITAEELDYFLQLQRIIELPLDHPERWGQRLLELGLISEDQLKIALIDHRRTGCTLRSALINRGWLNEDVLDRIF